MIRHVAHSAGTDTANSFGAEGRETYLRSKSPFVGS